MLQEFDNLCLLEDINGNTLLAEEKYDLQEIKDGIDLDKKRADKLNGFIVNEEGKWKVQESFFDYLKQLENMQLLGNTLNILLQQQNFLDFIQNGLAKDKVIFSYKVAEIIGINNNFYKKSIDQLDKNNISNNIISILSLYFISKGNINGRQWIISQVIELEKNETKPFLKNKINSIIDALNVQEDYFSGYNINAYGNKDLMNIINKNFQYIGIHEFKVLFGEYSSGRWNCVSMLESTTFAEQMMSEKIKLNIGTLMLSVRELFVLKHYNLIDIDIIKNQFNQVSNRDESREICGSYDPILFRKAQFVFHLGYNQDSIVKENLDDFKNIMDIIITESDFQSDLSVVLNSYKPNNDIILFYKVILGKKNNSFKTSIKETVFYLSDLIIEQNKPKNKEEFLRLNDEQKRNYLNNYPDLTANRNWGDFFLALLDYVKVETDSYIRNIIFGTLNKKYIYQSHHGNVFSIGINNSINDFLKNDLDFLIYLFENPIRILNDDKYIYLTQKKIIEKLKDKVNFSDEEYKLLYLILQNTIKDGTDSLYINDIKLIINSQNVELNKLQNLTENQKRFVLSINKLSHILDFKIGTLDILDLNQLSLDDIRIRHFDWHSYNRYFKYSKSEQILYLIGSRKNYIKNREQIKKMNLELDQSIINVLLWFESDINIKDEIFYFQELKDRINKDFLSNKEPFGNKNDWKFLGVSNRLEIEKILLGDHTHQYEKRKTMMTLEQKTLFIKYCNTYGILVDPRFFIKFNDNNSNYSIVIDIETDESLIIEFLKGLDTENLQEYSKFGIIDLSGIIELLKKYMEHNNDEIRKTALQKIINLPTQYRISEEFQNLGDMEDYGGRNTINSVGLQNNNETLKKIENINNYENVPERNITEHMIKRRDAKQQANIDMTTKTTKISSSGAIQDNQRGKEFNQEAENNKEKYQEFVDKLQKYATATLYMFLENNTDEHKNDYDSSSKNINGMKTETKNAIIKFIKGDSWTGTMIYNRISDWHSSGFSTNALGVTQMRIGKVSINLNIPLILEMSKESNESQNETVSDLDAIVDVFLHEFIHVIDYAIIGNTEHVFAKTKFRGVLLKEVLTELLSVYLELMGNDMEMKEIMQKALKKGMNSISFIQHLVKGYEQGADDIMMIKFMEHAREGGYMGQLMEIYIRGDLQGLKNLIDKVCQGKEGFIDLQDGKKPSDIVLIDLQNN